MNNVTSTADCPFSILAPYLASFNLKYIKKTPPLYVHCEKKNYDIDFIY